MKYSTPGSGHAIGPRRQGLNPSPSSWRLRRLHLCRVPLDDRFAQHLSSVCRTCEIRSIASDSLKNLVLKRCTWDRFPSDIASPTLKTLVIDGGSSAFGCTLAISAPMVAYLCLDVDADHFLGGISINKMTSLDRASIHLRCHEYSLSKSIVASKLRGDQSELLCSLSNVTSLELSGVGMMVCMLFAFLCSCSILFIRHSDNVLVVLSTSNVLQVLSEESAFQEFQKLRNLLLADCDLSDDFRILRFFHQGSPNLEKVTLRHCKVLHCSLVF
jgi:hypothetical protein